MRKRVLDSRLIWLLLIVLLLYTGCRKPLYTVSVGVRGEGQVITESDLTQVPGGTELTLSAEPAVGWQFDSWEGDLQYRTREITFRVEESVELTGVFVPVPVTVKVETSGEGSVSGLAPDRTVTYGSSITLEAEPAPGWEFSLWEVSRSDQPRASLVSNPMTFEADLNQEVTAVFERTPVSAAVSVEGSGTVARLLPESEVYYPGDRLTFEARPQAGWVFSRWELDSSLGGQRVIEENPAAVTAAERMELKAVFRRAYEIAWRFTLGDEIYSTAAVGPDGTIYIGSENGLLTAVSPEGRKLWSFETEGGVRSSPAVTGESVYFGSRDAAFYALSHEGTLMWRFETEGSILSSPAVARDGTIYFGSSDSHLYALRPDGTLRWKYKTGTLVSSSPTIAPDGTVYVGGLDRYFYALTPEGDLKWRVRSDFGLETDSAVAADGTIYFGSADRNLYAVSPEGKIKWRLETGDEIYSSPAVAADGTVYIGCDDYNLYAVYPDGTLRWTLKGGSAFVGTPLIGGTGTVYMGSDDSSLYAVSPEGKLLWKLRAGGQIYSSAVFAGPQLIVAGALDGKVYGFYVHDELDVADTPWPGARGGSSGLGRRP
jgi:outer membrane protein assembly factor BamB